MVEELTDSVFKVMLYILHHALNGYQVVQLDLRVNMLLVAVALVLLFYSKLSFCVTFGIKMMTLQP